MNQRRLLIAFNIIALAWAVLIGQNANANPWGASYFPNVELTNQDGETLRFFDDLIKDKIVAVNFIYTTCVDTCPLETAQLTKVQKILGDRLGDDIHFYSITIDPAHDTPKVLKRYRDQFKARWDFFTGKESDIVLLRKRLGLYIPDIQDGSKNHNVSMIIGNQKTGRWMKRSPFENPYVLADQLGSWLTGWKNAPKQVANYAVAPELRSISDGEQLFRSRCSICHSIDGVGEEGFVGPDLLGITQRRDRDWLISWLRAPDKMLADGDPLAVALFKAYNEVPMPNLRLSKLDVRDLLVFFEEEETRLGVHKAKEVAAKTERVASVTVPAANRPVDVVAVANAWIREPRPGAGATAGYMTLVNICATELELVELSSPAFKVVEVHEMVTVNELPKMQRVDPLIVPKNGQAQMRPGGKHIMLIGPQRELRVGESVEIKLKFASGEEQLVTAVVAGMDALGVETATR